MAPGAKRIAFGGLALAVVAWFAIDAWLPEAAPLVPEARDGAGLTPIPEVAARQPRLSTRGAAPVSSAAAPRAALEAVLVGCFRGLREDGAVLTESYWVAPDGAIHGEFREVNHDGTLAFHETMRIAQDGDIWRYRPAPSGAPAAVSFALVTHGPGSLRFANPDYDYPQRIDYQRRGTELATRIEGVEGGVTKTDAYATQAEACP